MDYLSWNDLLVKHYFDSSMAGREVLLYVNSEVIETLGKPYGVGVDDFIESVKKGPGWATRSRLCQRALQAYDHWRNRDLEYPPYVGYLVFFVLAAVTETDYAPYSYYPGLRKLLGESQDAGMPFRFDSMTYLWNDLEKWSREDRHEELGRFVARIRGGWVHVGQPRSQTVLSENERKHLSNIFDAAGLDPTDAPSPEIVLKILSYCGQSVLENRTRSLLESKQAEDDVLKRALVELTLDELEEWDGTVLEQVTKDESPRQQVHTSLRLCIKLDSLASRVEIYVRFKTSRPFPEEGLHFRSREDQHVWECIESQHGWSTPLRDYSKASPEKLNGALLNWAAGMRLTDSEVHWRAGLPMAEVRLFRLGIDGLPDWVETQRLERGIEFLVACKSALGEKLSDWGKDGCEHFEQKNVTGLPPGWLLYYGKNARESCPDIDILTLSTTVRLQLKEGVKADKGNVYFKFAPPKIALENSFGSERVMVDGRLLEQPDDNIPVFILPKDVPSNLPIRIEVDIGDHCLSKVIRLREFGLPHSFNETLFRDPTGDICSNDLPVYACGAHVFGELNGTQYHGPNLTYLSDKTVFIGERPGQVSYWPDEAYPLTWHPVWAVTKSKRKNWQVHFCGNPNQLKRVVSLPTPSGNRARIKRWKEAIWHKRKRCVPPEMEEVRLIWKDYMRLAKDV